MYGFFVDFERNSFVEGFVDNFNYLVVFLSQVIKKNGVSGVIIVVGKGSGFLCDVVDEVVVVVKGNKFVVFFDEIFDVRVIGFDIFDQVVEFMGFENEFVEGFVVEGGLLLIGGGFVGVQVDEDKVVNCGGGISGVEVVCVVFEYMVKVDLRLVVGVVGK